MKIEICPDCNSENIEITYNPKLNKYTLNCFDCYKYYKITEDSQKKIRCPECESENIIFEEDEIYCLDCGLVLSGLPPVYVAGLKILYDWGLIL